MERLKRVICFICVIAVCVTGSMEVHAEDDVRSEHKASDVSLDDKARIQEEDDRKEDAQMEVVTADCGMGIDTQASKETRVLLVGNSFTRTSIASNISYCVEQPLMDLAAAEGRALKVKTLAHGNARLKYYAGMDADHISYYRQFMKLIVNRKWDYIIFQEKTAEPIQFFESSTVPAIGRLQELVKVFQPHAKMLLYMNAGYSNGIPVKVNGTKRLLSTEEMELYLAAAFKELENIFGIEAIMVGMHSHRVNKLYPEISMVRSDDKHPEYAGYYLAACAFYYRMFRSLPYPWQISLTGSNLSEREISALYALPADSLSLNKKNITLNKGQKARLSANVSSRLPDSYDITYKSFNQSIASVDPESGLVTAKAEGETIVYAESKDGLQAFCKVKVKIPLSFNRSYYVAGKGDELWVQPQTNLSSLKWISSKKKVASVNAANGQIKAKTPGKVVIKVYNKKKPSEKASFTLYVACNAPKIVKTSAAKSKRGSSYADIKISWSSVQGASKYEIYRADKKNGKYRCVGTTSKRYFVDKTASPKKKYYYKVLAKNRYEQCTSPLSKWVKGKRKPLR